MSRSKAAVGGLVVVPQQCLDAIRVPGPFLRCRLTDGLASSFPAPAPLRAASARRTGLRCLAKRVQHEVPGCIHANGPVHPFDRRMTCPYVLRRPDLHWMNVCSAPSSFASLRQGSAFSTPEGFPGSSSRCCKALDASVVLSATAPVARPALRARVSGVRTGPQETGDDRTARRPDSPPCGGDCPPRVAQNEHGSSLRLRPAASSDSASGERLSRGGMS